MGFANVCDVQLQKPDIRFPLSPGHKHLLVLMFSSPMRCFCWYFSFNNNTIACFHIWSYAMSESEGKKTSPENLEMSLNWVFERTTRRKNYFWSDRSINDNLLCWCLNLRNWLSQPETFAIFWNKVTKVFSIELVQPYLSAPSAVKVKEMLLCLNCLKSFSLQKMIIQSDQTDVHIDVCGNGRSSMTKCT